MPIEPGQVVKATYGHDAEMFYVVLSVKEGFLLLADGRRRPLEKPKRKSIKHVRKTNKILSCEDMKTNKKLREALRAFHSGEGGKQLV